MMITANVDITVVAKEINKQINKLVWEILSSKDSCNDKKKAVILLRQARKKIIRDIINKTTRKDTTSNITDRIDQINEETKDFLEKNKIVLEIWNQ